MARTTTASSKKAGAKSAVNLEQKMTDLLAALERNRKATCKHDTKLEQTLDALLGALVQWGRGVEGQLNQLDEGYRNLSIAPPTPHPSPASSKTSDGLYIGRTNGPVVMKPSLLLDQHRDAIRQIVAAHRARNPRVFGSVLYGEDTDDSDLDLLVEPDDGMTLFDVGAIRGELHDLLGITVDVVTPRALPERFRSEVLAEAIPV